LTKNVKRQIQYYCCYPHCSIMTYLTVSFRSLIPIFIGFTTAWYLSTDSTVSVRIDTTLAVRLVRGMI
jgi:hypothetical protein